MSNKLKEIEKLEKLENYLIDKYGKEWTFNPEANVTPETCKEVQDLILKKESEAESYRGNIRRVFEKECPVCESLLLNTEDHLSYLLHKACHRCFIEHIDGREERWKSGWRPNGR